MIPPKPSFTYNWLYSTEAYTAYAFCIIGGLLEMQGIHLAPPYISPSAGWIKDYIDIFLVIIFPWGGWIFFAPSIIVFWRGGGLATVTRLLLLSAIIMGTLDTLVSFDSYKFSAFIKGTTHYMLVFAFSSFFGFIFSSAFVFLRKGASCGK